MEGRAAGEDSGKTGFSVCPGQKSLRQEQGGLVHSFFTMKLILPKATGTSTLCFLFLPQFPLGEEKKKTQGKDPFTLAILILLVELFHWQKAAEVEVW